MKKLFKVQSFTDVITNSSSEIFICTDVPKLSENAQARILQITDYKQAYEELSGSYDVELTYPDWFEWDVNEVYRQSLIEKHKDTLDEYIGAYYVELEDHYDFQAFERDCIEAEKLSLTSWSCR